MEPTVKLSVKPRAYSYIRFSSPEQASGDSYRRQSEKSIRYADEHGLELDDSLNLFDEGKSAYSGSHLKGKLGAFIQAVDEGVAAYEGHEVHVSL